MYPEIGWKGWTPWDLALFMGFQSVSHGQIILIQSGIILLFWARLYNPLLITLPHKKGHAYWVSLSPSCHVCRNKQVETSHKGDEGLSLRRNHGAPIQHMWNCVRLYTTSSAWILVPHHAGRKKQPLGHPSRVYTHREIFPKRGSLP